MDETKQISKIILDESRILLIFGAIISYFVGAGFVSYIGKNVDWFIFWLGLGIILMFFLSSQYLSLIFSRNPQFQSLEPKFRLKYKNTFLLLGLTTMSVGAISTFFLFYLIEDTMVIWSFFGFIVCS